MAKKQETKPQETKKQETKALTTAMPDYMKGIVAQQSADTGAMVASSISVPRLSYRGKRWRYIVDGEEELVKELTTSVVIVGVEPDAGRFIKTLYLSTYAPGDTSPPDCSSSNGVTPDIWVATPQAQRCGQCPKNVFGSAASRTGGKAKACHDSKRLWVVKPDDPEVVYGLNVPIMSLKNLADYGKYIAKNNFPLTLVITELSLDDEAEFPKLCFAHRGFIAEEYAKEVMELNQHRPWKVIVVPILMNDAGGQAVLPAPPVATVQGNTVPTGGGGIDKIIGEWK